MDGIISIIDTSTENDAGAGSPRHCFSVQIISSDGAVEIDEIGRFIGTVAHMLLGRLLWLCNHIGVIEDNGSFKAVSGNIAEFLLYSSGGHLLRRFW